MVGAGGIGCELLKNLLLTGYGEIHIVDLDTVTLSNLNRQFLFRQKDIDSSKSLTIAEAVQSFNYFGAKLIPHHGNIMDTEQFPSEWWNQFSYIFNALDNIEARRYVNKMCLFLKKPLMESGTTGFEGQIQPIYPYHSECFDCSTKVTPKTYPVCTIRSTPSQPVHCITWAKEFLFRQLFDENEGGDLKDSEKIKSETDDDQEIENMNAEVNELIDLRGLVLTSESEFITELIQKIFKNDIERLLMIDSLWKTRTRPIPLHYSEFANQLEELIQENVSLSDTKVWTVLENLYILYKSSRALQKRIQAGEGDIAFDKDDEDTLNFVVAAANLRSSIFHIDTMSKFDMKQIAGNIIPAIATTNAIVSGFSCLNGSNFFKYDYAGKTDYSTIAGESSSIFISIRPNKYITSATLVPPNEKCASSSLSSRGVVTFSPSHLKTLNLRWLVENLVVKYGFEEEGISIILGNSRLIYDADFDDNLDKSLGELTGISSGELILVQDENDELENLELYVTIGEVKKENILPEVRLRPKKVFQEESKQGEDEDEDLTMQEESILVDDEVEEPASKRRRQE